LSSRRCKSKTTYTRKIFFFLSIEDYLYQEMSNGEWEIIDQKALGTIRLSLALMVAFNIFSKRTTKNLIALPQMYEKPLESNNVFLIKKLFNL